MRAHNPYNALANDRLTHHAYRGYLIRWSIFTLDKPDNRVWVEKDNAFICWGKSVDEAKAAIDGITEWDSA